MEKNGNGTVETAKFDEAMCERYLFGELTESEQEEFEAAYFNDDAFFDKFVAVKVELLDLYARGEMDTNKRARMEPHFLSTAARRKGITESRDFVRAVTAISNRDRVEANAAVPDPAPGLLVSITRFFTIPRLAGVAALMLVVVGGLYILSRVGKNGPAVEQAEQQKPPTNIQNDQPGAVLSKSNSNGINANTEAGRDLTTIPLRPNEPDGRRTVTEPKKDGISVAGQKRPANKSGKDAHATRTSRDLVDDHVPEFALTLSTVGRDEADLSITLSSGSTRDVGAGNTLKLSRDDGDRPVTIGVLFKSERFRSYVVSIAGVDGDQVSKMAFGDGAVTSIHDGWRRVVVRIDKASRLKGKDYLVTLEGRTAAGKTETIAEYYLHIELGDTTDPKPSPKP